MPTLEQLQPHLNPNRSRNLDDAVCDSLVSLAFEFPEFPYSSIRDLRAILIVMYFMTPAAADRAIGRYLYSDAT